MELGRSFIARFKDLRASSVSEGCRGKQIIESPFASRSRVGASTKSNHKNGLCPREFFSVDVAVQLLTRERPRERAGYTR